MATINNIVDFTLKWEGGLSRNTNDTASSYPSPYVYKGQTGWHTNKGITYATFEAASKKLGFENNADNFLTMPQNIWLKIAKSLYWDTLHLDDVKSQAIANLLFSWTWASGYGWRNRVKNYFSSKDIDWSISDYSALPDNINSLTKKYGEKKISDELFEQYKEFYISLNQPANIGGWLNRLGELQDFSNSLMAMQLAFIKNLWAKPIGKVAIIGTPILIGGIITTIVLINSKTK